MLVDDTGQFGNAKKCSKIEYRKNLQTVSMLQCLDNLYDEYYHNKYEE